MEDQIITDGKYRYIEFGEGAPMIILHGLMGGLSNFEGVTSYFPEKGYKVLVLEKGKRLGAEDFPKTTWNLKRWMWMPRGWDAIA